jgi:hypothetical protein
MAINEMKRNEGERRTSGGVRGLVNSNEAMTELEHIVSIRRSQHHWPRLQKPGRRTLTAGK